jgi:glycosyltransferase involved in cell wall biosynthesis
MMRILYTAGPGDVIGTYQFWKRGEHDPRQVPITYSNQFFDVCREFGARGYVITYNEEPGWVKEESVCIENRPIPFLDRSGLLFHLGQMWYGFRLFLTALRFRADVAVISSGTHWFLLASMRLLRVQVIPSLHNVLWPKYRDRSRVQRLVGRWNGWFFRNHCAAVLSASEDIVEQVRELSGDRGPPLVEFLPIYQRETFAKITPPKADGRPFRVLFVGRVEAAKGVFDLLAICKFLREQGVDVEFDLCGRGSALIPLVRAVEEASLTEVFRCHGHCRREKVAEFLGRAHVSIVPTTTEFTEGFAMTVSEGVLAGRPVITSSVCPAARYVSEAIVEVPPDDVSGYAEAIRLLYTDREDYRIKCTACRQLQEQFYDRERGWAAGLGHILRALEAGRRPEPRSWLPRAESRST